MADVKDESQKTEKKTETAVDYKAKFEQREKDYAELQSKATKDAQDAKTAQETLDLIAENDLLDWDRMNKPKDTPENKEPEYVDAKTLEKKLAETERRLNVSQSLHEFRIANPDLAHPKYERIVTAELGELIQKNTRAGRLTKSRQELMVLAAENTRKFLSEERAKGQTEAEEKKKKEAESLGLGSEGSTPPATPDDEGEGVVDYIARRKKQRLAKIN